MPLLLLATVGVACFLSGESPEGPTASVRGVLENSAGIDTMAVARNGTMVAISDMAGIVQLWRPETGRRRGLLGEHPAHATCVAFAPDGATLAIGQVNSTVSIWDVASGAIRWSVSHHSGRQRTVAFSPDGATLASGGSDRQVCLWDMASHRLKAHLTGHTGMVTAVAFAPDGQTLVSGSQDGTIRCWDAVNNKARWVMRARLDDHEYRGHTPTVLSVRFSPDGRTLATASLGDPAVRIWDPATGRVRMSLCGLTDMVTSVDIAPDGATLVTGDNRGSLTFWDLKSGQPQSIWNAQNHWIKSVVFFGDGRTLASAGDGVVKLWDMSGKGER